MKNLATGKVGEFVVVKELLSVGRARQRMIDMGIYNGVKMEIKKLAPLGDPMEVELKDFTIAIRKSDAAKIIVELA